MAEQGIWIVTAEIDTNPPTGEKSVDGYAPIYDELEISQPPQRRRQRIKTAELKQQMGEFVEGIEAVFDQVDQKNPHIRLDEIELTVEVNAEGEVSLWGLGGTSVGGSAAITLKFSRQSV